MSWQSVIFQSLLAMVLWGLGMTLVFGWPRDTLALPMGMFGSLMFALLGTVKVIKDRRNPK